MREGCLLLPVQPLIMYFKNINEKASCGVNLRRVRVRDFHNKFVLKKQTSPDRDSVIIQYIIVRPSQ